MRRRDETERLEEEGREQPAEGHHEHEEHAQLLVDEDGAGQHRRARHEGGERGGEDGHPDPPQTLAHPPGGGARPRQPVRHPVVDGEVDGEADRQRDDDRLDDVERPAEQHDGGDREEDDAGDGEDREDGDDRVQRRDEHHEEGDGEREPDRRVGSASERLLEVVEEEAAAARRQETGTQPGWRQRELRGHEAVKHRVVRGHLPVRQRVGEVGFEREDVAAHRVVRGEDGHSDDRLGVLVRREGVAHDVVLEERGAAAQEGGVEGRRAAEAALDEGRLGRVGVGADVGEGASVRHRAARLHPVQHHERLRLERLAELQQPALGRDGVRVEGGVPLQPRPRGDVVPRLPPHRLEPVAGVARDESEDDVEVDLLLRVGVSLHHRRELPPQPLVPLLQQVRRAEDLEAGRRGEVEAGGVEDGDRRAGHPRREEGDGEGGGAPQDGGDGRVERPADGAAGARHECVACARDPRDARVRVAARRHRVERGDDGRRPRQHHEQVRQHGESGEDAEAAHRRDARREVDEERRCGRQARDGDRDAGVSVGAPQRVRPAVTRAGGVARPPPRVVEDEDVVGADRDEQQIGEQVDEREEGETEDERVEEVGEREAQLDVEDGGDEEDDRAEVDVHEDAHHRHRHAEVTQVREHELREQLVLDEVVEAELDAGQSDRPEGDLAPREALLVEPLLLVEAAARFVVQERVTEAEVRLRREAAVRQVVQRVEDETRVGALRGVAERRRLRGAAPLPQRPAAVVPLAAVQQVARCGDVGVVQLRAALAAQRRHVVRDRLDGARRAEERLDEALGEGAHVAQRGRREEVRGRAAAGRLQHQLHGADL